MLAQQLLLFAATAILAVRCDPSYSSHLAIELLPEPRATPPIVEIPSEDRAYLSERLQSSDGLSTEEAALAIDQLAYYYSGLKAGLHGSPSILVDTAWHAHILATKMYLRFCRQTFGHYLHHTPFWSGNPELAQQSQFLYPPLIRMFGSSIDPTAWLPKGKLGSADCCDPLSPHPADNGTSLEAGCITRAQSGCGKSNCDGSASCIGETVF